MPLTRAFLAPAAILALALSACGAQGPDPAPAPSPTADASVSPTPTGPSEEESQEVDTIRACVFADLSVRAWDTAEELEGSEAGDSTAESLNAVGDTYAASITDLLGQMSPQAQEAVADQATAEDVGKALHKWCLDTKVIDKEGEPIDPPPGYEPPTEENRPAPSTG